jgi:hypothetical protein
MNVLAHIMGVKLFLRSEALKLLVDIEAINWRTAIHESIVGRHRGKVISGVRHGWRCADALIMLSPYRSVDMSLFRIGCT